MGLSRLEGPRSAAALYRRWRPPCLGSRRCRTLGVFRVAPAFGQRFRRLARARGAETVFNPGFGHRKPVGLGRAPTVGAQPAVERRAAPGAGEAARGGRAWSHRSSLRADSDKGKIVTWANRISRIASTCALLVSLILSASSAPCLPRC